MRVSGFWVTLIATHHVIEGATSERVLYVFVRVAEAIVCESSRAIARRASANEEIYQLSRKKGVQIIPADVPTLYKHDATPAEAFMRKVVFVVQDISHTRWRTQVCASVAFSCKSCATWEISISSDTSEFHSHSSMHTDGQEFERDTVVQRLSSGLNAARSTTTRKTQTGYPKAFACKPYRSLLGFV